MNTKTLKLTEIVEAKVNTRGKTLGNLEDLVASVKEQGVLTPIIVRPVGAKFEVVAGSRRFAAAKQAKLAEIPAVVMELTDPEALEVQIIENLQRADVHPLDESAAYLKLGSTIEDMRAVAARVGKSEAYVRARVQLGHLAPEVAAAYRAGDLNDGQAAEIAKLSPGGDQQKALTHVKRMQSWGERVYSVKDLNGWMRDTFSNELAFQPWLKSAEATQAVGPCKGCPANTSTLFGEVKVGACTTTRCHRRKLQKWIEWMQERTPGLVLVSAGYDRANGTLGQYDYAVVKKGTKGSVPALIVAGPGRGRMISITTKREKPVSQMTPEEKAKHDEAVRKEAAAEAKKKAADQAKEDKKTEAMLAKITWPLTEQHLGVLFRIALAASNSSDANDIAKRRKLEWKRDADGDYEDMEAGLTKLFEQATPVEKLRLTFELTIKSSWYAADFAKLI